MNFLRGYLAPRLKYVALARQKHHCCVVCVYHERLHSIISVSPDWGSFPLAKNEVHNSLAVLALTLAKSARLIQVLLPKATELVCQTKAF